MLKKIRKRKIAAYSLFAIYLLYLFYFLFFAELMGRADENRRYAYNLELFKEIKRFITYRHILGFRAVFLNLAGNVIGFIPFGYFLPINSSRCRNFFFVVLLTFTTSLVIEGLQLIFKVGSFDVDDILLNTLGGLIGYLIYLGYAFLCKKRRNRKRK